MKPMTTILLRSMDGVQLADDQVEGGSSLTITAGLPATTTFGGTLLVTTAPAATTEFSPMVTPLRMTAFMPIQTLSEMMTGAVRIVGRGGRSLKNGARARASMMRCAGARGWKSESAIPTFHEMRQWEPISIRSSAITSAPFKRVKSPTRQLPFAPTEKE